MTTGWRGEHADWRSGPTPLIGQTLDELQLRARFGANVIGMERWRKFRRVMVSVTGVTEFQAKDVLLIDMSDPEVDVREFCSEARLEPMILRGEYFSDQAREVGMAEVSSSPAPGCSARASAR